MVVKGCEQGGCERGSCCDLLVFSKCCSPVPWTYLAGVCIGHPFRLGDRLNDLPNDQEYGLPYDRRYGPPFDHECGLLDDLQDGLQGGLLDGRPTDHQRDQPGDRLHDLRYDRPNDLAHGLAHDLRYDLLPALLHALLYDPPTGHHYANGDVGICWEHNCRWHRAEYGLVLSGDCEWSEATGLCYRVGRIRRHHISELLHLRICNKSRMLERTSWLNIG